MKIICSCSADTYITDKIVGDIYANDSNVGKAATLDLFKLYAETEFRGTGSQHELSRVLLKFDLSKAKKLLGTKIDLDSSTFTAKLKMFDIKTGHATPSNFSVSAMPLSKSFNEGIGRDVSTLSTLDVANFLTASITNGTVNLWHVSGANQTGDAGATLDAIKRINLNDSLGLSNVYGTMHFDTGNEDLSIDVTRAISGTLSNQMSDHGFRISFDGTYETDKKSRFVKRFASRHVLNPHLRPHLEISFDDSIIDSRENFFFDKTSTIFIANNSAGRFLNIKSGSNSAQISGNNCMNLKIKAGKYSRTFNVSQHGNQIGIYSSSFSLPSSIDADYSTNIKVQKMIDDNGFLDFTTYWTSLDGSVVFHTGSLRIKKSKVNLGPSANSNLELYALNLQSRYNIKDEARIRVFCKDHDDFKNVRNKIQIKQKSKILDTVYYRVVDSDTGKIVLDFGEDNNSTRLSTDSDGLYFDLHFDSLPHGRSYCLEYLVVNLGTRQILKDDKNKFLVV